MNRYLLTSCFLFCTPNHNSVVASVSSKEETYAGAIAVQDESGNFIPVGSGVYAKSAIGKGILTAKHVAAISSVTDLYICDLRVRFCEPLKNTYISSSNGSLDRDWAFFVQDNSYLSLMKPFKKYKIKDDVTAIGMSWGTIPWVSEGNISWVEDNLFLVDAYCAPGCSGGPILNEKDQLIGIISALNVSEWGPQNNQLFIVPISNIEIFQ